MDRLRTDGRRPPRLRAGLALVAAQVLVAVPVCLFLF
jgi:hypothetical protein